MKGNELLLLAGGAFAVWCAAKGSMTPWKPTAKRLALPIAARRLPAPKPVEDFGSPGAHVVGTIAPVTPESEFMRLSSIRNAMEQPSLLRYDDPSPGTMVVYDAKGAHLTQGFTGPGFKSGEIYRHPDRRAGIDPIYASRPN